jgi:hypothetical protein
MAHSLKASLLHFVVFAAGLGLLFTIAAVTNPESPGR